MSEKSTLEVDLHTTDRRPAAATPHRTALLSAGHGFLESPRWHNGALYASDMTAHRVLRFDEAFIPQTVCEVAGRPSGLGWDPDDRLLIVSMADRRLLRWEEDGVLVEVADLGEVIEYDANDMVVDREGRCYIGNFGWDGSNGDEVWTTHLVAVEPDASVRVVATDLTFPNGMVITPDGSTLLVAETLAARITAFDRAPDGSLSHRRVWAGFGPSDGFMSIETALRSRVPLPDGLALAGDGTLWMGDAGGSGALRVAQGGRILDAVRTSPLTAFAVAVGDTEDEQLFLCAAPPLATDPQSGDSRLLRANLAGVH